MIRKLKMLYDKHKEIINYIIFGIITTAVNWISYALLVYVLKNTTTLNEDIYTNTSNIISWIIAIIFAFITNKIWVFESKTWELKTTLREAGSFLGSRTLSFFIEIGSFNLLIKAGLSQSLFGVEGFFAKIIVTIVAVILNYFFSKLFVFKK